MNCGNCGAPITKKDKFCGSCGAPRVAQKANGGILKILIPILASVILIGGGIGALFITGVLPPDSDKTTISDSKKDKEKDKDKDKDKKPTSTPKPTATTKPTATPKPTATSTPTPTEVPEPTESYRTIMIYMVGSNLETDGYQATADLTEMLAADLGDSTSVVIQTGGAKKWHTDGFEDGQAQRWVIKDNKLVELESLGKYSMVDTNHFQEFIEFAAENYPAEHYTIVLWNHGGGVPIGFGSDEIFTDDGLDDVEIGAALKNSGVHFDALLTDACLMCSLEFFKAIEDSVDYAVAAESSVWAGADPYTGVNYKNWLTTAAQSDKTTINYCEQIVDDYMDYIHNNGLTGSMSVIRMDKIEEVYDAYVDYMKELSKTYEYATYYQARINCGLYETTDSVDISTLAGALKNNYTTELQNAVSNAVVRTESDYPYGHGITVYSPIDLVAYPQYEYDVYAYGRASLVTLNYDSAIIEFYDNFVSKIYYENGWESFAGDWYISPSGTTTTTTDEHKLDEPEIIEKVDYVAVEVTEEDWSVIKSVLMEMYMTSSDGTTIRLGVDKQYEIDADGDIVFTAPEKWLSIAGLFPSSASYVWEETNDGWYKMYYVMAYVNGEEAVLIVYCDQDNPEGTVIGFAYADFETWEVGDIFDLWDTDDIQLAQLMYDSNWNEYYEPIGDSLSVDDLTISWTDPTTISDVSIAIGFYITDIYGNTYNTEYYYT